MAEGESTAVVGADIDDLGWANTRLWVERNLSPGDRIRAVATLRGGWTSQMRRLHVEGEGGPYSVVLRSFVKPFFVKHALGLLTREADILRLLADTNVPAASLRGVDAAAEHCDHPSSLMSLLPGSVRLDGEDIERRTELLARQLVAIHMLVVPEDVRPRNYQAWTSPERVQVPEQPNQPDVWQRAVDVIRRPPTNLVSCTATSTSWGPADLDLAHCSTALALLHGVHVGMHLADHYIAAGGTLSADPADHLNWRVLDALAFAPDAEKVAGPRRGLGRVDLTSAVLAQRLEEYLQALFSRHG
ncbi:phosphotransferase [Streptomyces sp. NPDC095817]|uniref:phosphotransferase family protein n=1 Tax=Streptomyces sp. NPDC095817 TaxID=3155082 RepID=UPI00331D6C0C